MSDRSRMRAKTAPRFGKPIEPAPRPRYRHYSDRYRYYLPAKPFDDLPLVIVPEHGGPPLVTDSRLQGEFRITRSGEVWVIRLKCEGGKWWDVPPTHPIFDALAVSLRITHGPKIDEKLSKPWEAA